MTAPTTEAPRSSRNALILVAIAVLLAATFVRGFMSSRTVVAEAPFDVSVRPGDIVLGSPTAGATVLALVSPTCIHCARWSVKTLPILSRGPVAQGELRILIRDYDRDAQAIRLSASLRCLPEERRAEAHAAIMSATFDGSPPEDMGRVVGMSAAQAASLASCAAATAPDVARTEYETTRMFGPRGTPTFVSGRLMRTGDMDPEEFAEFLEQANGRMH